MNWTSSLSSMGANDKTKRREEDKLKILEQRSFLEREIREREKEVERLGNEIIAMKEILLTLETIEPPCGECNGKGQLLAFDGGDSYFETCDKCKGTGRA